MTESIRIRLSAGFLIVAIVHAIAIYVGLNVMRWTEPERPEPAPWTLDPDPAPTGAPISASPRPFEQPPKVNWHAQGELKQQCPDGLCQVVRPGERIVHVGPWRTVPATIPAGQGGENAAARPPQKPYQLLLFLDDSMQSRQIVQWFESNTDLAVLRGKSEFQVYTAQNAIYRARFTTVVPMEQFPAIVLQDRSGGHIHAAGKNMLPGSAAELVKDFRAAYGLYKQAKAGAIQATGAIRETGYSWDNAIRPNMRLSDADCGPDGCPNPDRWRPFDRDVDRDTGLGGLFNSGRDARDMFVWANAIEIATLCVFGVAGVLLLIIVSRRGTPS